MANNIGKTFEFYHEGAVVKLKLVDTKDDYCVGCLFHEDKKYCNFQRVSGTIGFCNEFRGKKVGQSVPLTKLK